MRVYCTFSGMEYQVPHFANTKIEGHHPLFYASTKQLLSRAGDWAAGKLEVSERKILFLALLRNTDLVEFRVTAQPADTTVQLNMESLIKFVGWYSTITIPSLALPRFVISNDTKTLDNVKHWLDAWYTARKDFEDGYKATGELRETRNREAALSRLLRDWRKKPEDYAGIMAGWAMSASGMRPGVQCDEWTALFKLKGIAIYQANADDIQDCLDWMEENLDSGTEQCHAVLKHLRILQAKNKTGLNFGLGIPDEELENMDLAAMAANPYRVVEDSMETYNAQVIAANAPVSEPKANEYPTRVAYLRAKAAWNLAQKASKYAAEATSQIVDDSALNVDVATDQEGSDADNDDIGDL